MNLKIIYLFMLSLLLIINIRAQIEFPPDATLPNYQSGKGNEIPPTIIPKGVISPNGPDIRINPSTYHQSQLSIAISPVDEEVLLTSADINQSGGLGIGIGYYYSTDGGNVWNGSDELPSGCSNASNPAVVIDNNGYFYIGSINFSYGQGVMRSTDNGASWTYYTVANAQESEPLYVLGNNHLAVDNTGGQYNGYLYSAWSNFAYLPTRRIEFARSTNQGQTWLTTAVISAGIPNGHTFGHQGVNLQVGYDGTIYACWAVRDAVPPFTERGIGFNKSTDGGLTWEIPHYAINNIFGIRAPDGYSEILPIWTNSFPVMAIDNQRDKIYISWINVGVPGVNTGDPDVYIISSENQGVSWSTPIRVNTDQVGNSAIQFHSWLSVDQTTGDVYVAFYDNRGSINSNIWEFYLAKSFDKGETFTDFAVSDDAFSINPIWGFYFGNYTGLTASLGSVYPVWNAHNPSSISQAWLSKVEYQVISIDQEKEDGTRMTFTNIGRWNGSSFYDIPIKNNPAKISIEAEGNEVLRGLQQSSANQKYNNWNALSDVTNHHVFIIDQNLPTTLTSNFKGAYSGVKIQNYFLDAPTLNPETDYIKFIDPWLVDYPDPDFGNNKRNRGKDDSFDWQRLSPFYPDYSSSYDGNVYQGIFLNQNPTFDPTKPNYSVKVDHYQDIPLTQTGKTHRFYFQNWGGSEVQYENANLLQTGIIFKNDIQWVDPVAQANLKGTQLSSTSSTYNNTSQNKFLKTSNGYLHNIYESMGDVWYERSTDGGTTWVIMNDGKPINPYPDYGEAKSPSIACSNDGNDLIYITYQSTIDNSSLPGPVVMLTQYKNGIFSWNRVVYDLSAYSFTSDYEQVVAAMSGLALVVFNPPSPSTLGLIAKEYTISPYPNFNVTAEYTRTLPNVDVSSVLPSIAAGGGKYHLVYQQAAFSIKYLRWTGNTNPLTSSYFSTPSTGSGYSINSNPSISLANFNPVISWKGTDSRREAVLRRGTLSGFNMIWGDFLKVGSLVNYIHNNSANNTTEQTVMCYSQDGPISKWVTRTYYSGHTTYSTPANLSHNGISIQVTNGTDYSNMKANIFQSSAPPYYFTTSTTNFNGDQSEGGLEKITMDDTLVTFGRSGVADMNGIEFVFNIGDILVGDSIIQFINKPDTIVYASSNELNEFTRTNQFTLTPETDFYFTNIYYVVQKSNPDTSLIASDEVNFKAELVNAISNQVVGTFDNITYNKNNLEKYASLDYSVDCSGITPGEYYLRLVTNVNGNSNYALANIISDNTTLAKKNFNKVNFTGGEIPITYDLAQNFPNPFNPSTTIRYQIPQDGIVTLKIFDILGAEVTTLVNEEKIAGKYEVNFNASNYASGVYIYKIQAGSFINSKKMILLK